MEEARAMEAMTEADRRVREEARRLRLGALVIPSSDGGQAAAKNAEDGARDLGASKCATRSPGYWPAWVSPPFDVPGVHC